MAMLNNQRVYDYMDIKLLFFVLILLYLVGGLEH